MMPGEIAGHCEAIYRKIVLDNHVSMIEIGRLLEERGVETHGNTAIALDKTNINLILWAGMSEDFAAIITALQQDYRDRVLPTPASTLVYLADGGGLTLPIAKRPPKGGYREPHWLPITFMVREPEAKKRKR